MQIVFGISDIGVETGTRFLVPGFDRGPAWLVPIGFCSVRPVLVTSMTVQQNSTPGGEQVNYHLRVNGIIVMSVLGVDGNTSQAVNDAHTADIQQHDSVEVAVEVLVPLASGVRNVIVALEAK